jgi:hypothetical protein
MTKKHKRQEEHADKNTAVTGTCPRCDTNNTTLNRAFSFAAEPGPYCHRCMADTLEEASLGVHFPRTTWPVRELHALISELPALPPETQDDDEYDDDGEHEQG